MKVTFGDFTLDTGTRQLLRGRAHAEVHLSPKAFDLLAILVASRPGVVTKESLRDRLWAGTNVVAANLNNLASEVRAALGDDPQQPRYVRTVHGVGYAFCGQAEGHRAVPSDDAANRMWLVYEGRTVVLEQPETIIGRDPKCAIWIDVPGVSRRHAAIRLVSNGVMTNAVLEDLASTNGTFVNDRPVNSPVTLEDGQTIRVGEATLTFRASASAGAATKKIRREPAG
jgi:DNA-binding winged helix-turn-helix (wHTH) protein